MPVGSDPIWTAEDRGQFEFKVNHTMPGILQFEMFDWNRVSASKRMGFVEISGLGAKLDAGKNSISDWFPLQAKKAGDKGFKGAMATFDASRPIVAAMAVGVGRAALELVVEELTARGVVVRYDAPLARQTAIERDVMEMEAQLQAARLLTWRAASMMTRGKPNNLEASMAKAKAGLAVTHITQKAVELLGPPGYSQQLLVEKWMREARAIGLWLGGVDAAREDAGRELAAVDGPVSLCLEAG